MATPSDIFNEIYVARRMKEVRRAKALPPSMQYDLATSDLDDDHVEQMLEVFDPENAPAGRAGIGISEVFNSMMRREPNSAPIPDLKKMQQRLIEDGYVAPNTPVDGIWSEVYASGYRRLERDLFDDHLSGNRPMSASLAKGIEYLGYITPPAVWQGIVGSARGLKEQAGESAENLGLLGGAAAGAAIGGTAGAAFGGIGAIPGAIGGAIVGGVTGFLGDIIGEDEGEEGQSDFSKLIDALSPFEEYSAEDGAERFFADLNLVASAASMISGAGMAAGAGRLLGGGIRTSLKHGVPLQNALLARSVTQTAPGMVTRAITSAKAPLTMGAGGAAIGGLLGGEEGALAGGLAGAGFGLGGKFAAGPIRNFMTRHNLLTATSRPILKTANGVFTGASAGQFGSRVISDVLPGVSEVEEGIEREPRPPGADVLDWLGLVIWPSQIFPMKAGQVASRVAESRMMRQGFDWAYDVATMGARDEAGKLMNRHQRRSAYRKALSPSGEEDDALNILVSDLQLRVSMGRDYKVESSLASRRFEPGSYDYWEEKSRLLREETQSLRDEWAAVNGGEASSAPVTDDFASWSVGQSDDSLKGPTAYAAWLKQLEAGRGRGILEGMQSQILAEKVAARANAALEGKKISLAFGKNAGKRPTLGSEGMVSPEVELQRLRETIRRSDVESLSGDPSSRAQALFRIVARTMPEDEARALGAELNGLPVNDRLQRLENMVPPQAEASLAQQVAAESSVVTETKSLTAIIRGSARKMTNPEYRTVQDSIKDLRKRADKIEILNSADAVAAQEQKALLLDQANTLQAQLKTMEKTVEAPMSFTVANIHDPSRGLWGAPTEQEVGRLTGRLQDAMDQMKTLQKNLSDGADPVEIGSKLDELTLTLTDPQEGLLTQLFGRDLIDTKMFEFAHQGLERANVLERGMWKRLQPVKAHLEKIQHFFGQEIENVDEIVQSLGITLPEGKTLIATGDAIIRWDEIPKALASKNLDEFTRNPNVWDSLGYYAETIGLSPALHTDHALFRLRQAHQETTVNRELRLLEKEMGITLNLNGRQALRRIRNGMQEFNGGEGVIPENVFLHRRAVDPTGAVKGERRFPLLEVRQVKRDQIRDWLDLDKLLPAEVSPDQVALRIYGALKTGSAMGAEMNLMHPLDSMRMVGKALRVDGLPGFVDWMRQWHIKDPRRAGAVAGGVAGAFVGGTEGARIPGTPIESEGGVGGAIVGGLFGAGVGASLGQAMKMKFPEGTYGYLPDYLHRASMAARYTFSLAFDMGRYVENASVSTMRENLPFVLKADNYIRKNQWTSLEGNGIVTGDDAMREAINLGNRIRGRGDLEVLDEMMVWMFQKGIVGYSPRLQESARAYMIAQRHVERGGKMTKSFIRELEQRTRALEGYGVGRRQLEKSVNFIFFPASFQKKLLGAVGDFLTQAPGRALMIHEGYRAFHNLGLDDKAAGFIEQRIPFAQQLKRLNNLAYGISPGRFFLQGLTEHQTDLGTAMQALSTVYLPSGANTPAAQLFGGLGDAAIHFFSPYVVTDDIPVQEAWDTVVDFVPAIRDLERMRVAAGEQVTALTTPGGAPYYQMQTYLDGKRAMRAKWKPIADMLGYSSVDGLLQSTVGKGIAAKLEQDTLELGDQFRQGQALASSFENKAALNKQALYAIGENPNRSQAEDVILQISQMNEMVSAAVEVTGLPKAAVQAVMSRRIRETALEHADDREFATLWKQFFEFDFGPLRVIA